MVVKINAIEVPEGRGPELEARFAKRAREVEGMPGFLGFELLRPAKGETRYFVFTRWESGERFRAWMESSAFDRGHAQAAKDSRGTVARGSALLEFLRGYSSLLGQFGVACSPGNTRSTP